MSERYALRGLGGEPPHYEWIAAGAPGAPAQGTADECAAALGDAPAVILLDATAVRMLAVNVPGRSPRVVAQAVPFAVEDELAEDVERLEFAIGPAVPGGARLVAVIAREALARVLEPLVAAGVRCECAIPEILALPDHSPQWTSWLDGERLLVRETAGRGFALEAEAGLRVLASRLAEARPEGLVHLTAPEAAIPAALRAACGAVPIAVQAERAGGLTLLAAHLPERPPVDLLPERWRRHDEARGGRRIYAVAASLAACALVLHLALTVFEVFELKQNLARVKAAQAARFHQAFPGVQRLVEGALRVQAEQELGKLRAARKPEALFLDLLATSGRVLSEQRALGISLEGFSYADGVLILRLATPDVANLEQYRQALGKGINAEVVSAESGEHGVSGTLRLRGTGS